MSPASSPSWACQPPKPTTGGCSQSCATCDLDRSAWTPPDHLLAVMPARPAAPTIKLRQETLRRDSAHGPNQDHLSGPVGLVGALRPPYAGGVRAAETP